MLRDFCELNAEHFPELLDLCAANLPLDTFSLPLMKARLLADPRYDERFSLGWRDAGRLVGAASGVIRTLREGGRHGWIRLLVVDRGHRRAGLGRRLLRELESRLQQDQITAIDTAGYPYYFWPGVDVRYTPACCLMEAEGYSLVRHNVNMSVDLANQSFGTQREEAQLAREGLVLRRIDESSLPGVIKLLQDNEWWIWCDEVAIAAQNRPASAFLIARGDRVVSFAAYDACMFYGTFGPTGTDPAFRGRGLGTILLKKCLQELKQRGERKCEIAWVGPVAYYARQVDAVISRVFREYRKTLTPPQQP